MAAEPSGSPAVPAPAKPPAPTALQRRRRWLGGTAAAVITGGALLALLASAPWTDFGTQVLLDQVPGLSVKAPVGQLFGDFQADRFVYTLPNSQRLVVDKPAWTQLRLGREQGIWTVHLASFHAARVTLQGSSNNPAPLRLPADLVLPVAVTVDALQVDRIEAEDAVNASAGSAVRDLQARLSLGAGAQATHHLDALQARWDRLQATGALQLRAAAPMPLQAQLQLLPDAPALLAAPAGPLSAASATAAARPPLDWRATLTAQGPLRTVDLSAVVSAAGQRLDALAVLTPEAAWPLAHLNARAEQLDLAPLSAGWPSTSLSGTLELAPLAPGTPGASGERAVRLQADLRNGRPGRIADGALPLKRLQLSAQSDLDKPERGRLERLSVELADAQGDAGELNGDGQWALEGQGLQRLLRWTLNTEVKDLQPTRLDARAPALRLRGPLIAGGAWPLPVRAEPTPRSSASAASKAELGRRAKRGSRAASGTHPAIAPANAPANAPVNAAANAPPDSPRSAAVGAPGNAAAVQEPGVPDAQWRLRTELSSEFPQTRLPEASVKLQLQGTRRDLLLDSLEASAGTGTARTSARLSGRLQQVATGATDAALQRWRLKLDGQLQAFNPALWWPGTPADVKTGWQRGTHRLNGSWQTDLTASLDTSKLSEPGALRTIAQTLQGSLDADIKPSTVASVPLTGQVKLRRGTATPPAGLPAAAPIATPATPPANTSALDIQVELAAGKTPNRFAVQGQLDTVGTQDRWTLNWNAPDLAGLNEALRLVAGTSAPMLSGDTQGQAQMSGRWPALATQGQAAATQLNLAWPASPAGAAGNARLWALRGLSMRWQGATTGTADLSASLSLAQWRSTTGNAANTATSAAARTDDPRVDKLSIELRGQAAAHHLEVQGEVIPAGPRRPGWPERGRLTAQADGALRVDTRNDTLAWDGQLHDLSLADLPFSLRADPARLQFSRGPAGSQLELGATRLFINEGVLAIETLQWQQGSASTSAAAGSQLRLKARLESLNVVPFLQKLQPEFGWGGDLRMVGRLDLTATPERVSVQAELKRDQGDLVVQDPDSPSGPQRLGLKDLQLTLQAQNGQWRFNQRVSGGNLGQLEGEQIVSADPAAWLPGEVAPVKGQLDLRVDQLGNWGRWLPAGWRLSGQLASQARVSGRWGAPQFSGELNGRQIAVRNVLEGVDWQDAELRIALEGETARIERLSVKAGNGTLSATGKATLGATPRAELQLRAERFAVLQRVDRRVVISGAAALGLDARNTSLKGSISADEGRIDFTRSDAPALDDDVNVVRASGPAASAGSAATSAPREPRRQDIDLRLNLGKAFTLKGRGLNTRLEGEVQLTSPANRLSANGTIRAVDGTYAAYGQKLAIDRGDIVFRGPINNARLDIQATRSDLDDVRVGVAITGTSQSPRVRLFSDPEMTDNDKLSWLLLGRASDGLGRTDLALLQRAAYALLAGESDSPSLMQRIGLDSVSLRQETDGDVRATVVSLGKQISRRWYVGYERSLNATAGTWQLIYRIAQRFTLRAQSGAENSLDLIWSWKWGPDQPANQSTNSAPPR